MLRMALFPRFRSDLDVLLARGALFPVFTYPGIEALAGGGIAIAEFQRGDFRIGNRKLLACGARNDADERIGKSASGAAVKKIAFDFSAVFAGDAYIATVIKGFFQRLANIFFSCQFGNPTFQAL